MSNAARRANETAPRRGSFRGLARRDPRARLAVTLAYKGGAEAWVVIEARGRVQVLPGHMSIYDVVQILSGRGSHAPE